MSETEADAAPAEAEAASPNRPAIEASTIPPRGLGRSPATSSRR